MATAAQIMAQYGFVNTDAIAEAVQLEGIDPAAAAAMVSMESGGQHIWGADPVSTGGAYVKNGPVTQANYLAYRALVQAGQIGRQGCGIAQLTSQGYQDSGDALGGCWDPVANARAGFRGLQQLIAAYGLQDGARRYNGSGPAAVAYANKFMALHATWSARLAGAEEDDLTPQESQMLADLHDRVARVEQAWAGGITDDQGTAYDIFEYVKRVDVEVHQVLLKLTALIAKLGLDI